MTAHETQATSPRSRKAGDTRGTLIRAAERLFAVKGVDGASLNEIKRAAGQRNAMALQYHFGDRAGLLRAVLDKHLPAVDTRREVLLQQYEDSGDSDSDSDSGSGGDADLRSLAAALVLPAAAKLADPDGGREFLQIVAELLNRPEPLVEVVVTEESSIYPWRRLLEPLLTSESTAVFHTRFTAMRFCHAELAARAAARPREDDRLFTSRLVDLVTALLAAPVSEQTARLLRERNRTSTARAGRTSAARTRP
ncbi:helix-turn-helix domain-containing protein [Streptomyces sp. NPDC048256]|uniref:TetR/AcrR family transcriptional regulator n=1 Tax=unclassified Streptomyces TaxID=2593676 RepID=UPI0033EEDE6C